MTYLLAVFAAYRLAQLISVDLIARPLRFAIGKRAAGSRAWWWLAELVNCEFCTGVWISAVLAAWLFPGQWLLYWLAIAGGQAFLAGMVTHGTS